MDNQSKVIDFKSKSAQDSLDNLITSSLLSNSYFETQSDLYVRIMNGVGKKKPFFSKTIIKNAAALFIIFSITLTGILALSEDARVAAENAIKRVTSVFTVEKEGDQYIVKEVPTDEKIWAPGCRVPFRDSDEELSKQIGYPVKIPESFGSYYLDDKFLGMGLTKAMDYNTLLSLGDKVDAAISDPKVYEELKPYGPEKSSSALYINKDKYKVLNIFINKNIFGLEGTVKSKYGFNYIYSEYPVTYRYEPDEKPEINSVCHGMIVIKDNLSYYMRFSYIDMTEEEGIEVANSFLDAVSKKE